MCTVCKCNTAGRGPSCRGAARGRNASSSGLLFGIIIIVYNTARVRAGTILCRFAQTYII